MKKLILLTVLAVTMAAGSAVANNPRLVDRAYDIAEELDDVYLEQHEKREIRKHFRQIEDIINGNGYNNPRTAWISPSNLKMRHWKPITSWPYCADSRTLNRICKQNGYSAYAGDFKSGGSGWCAKANPDGINWNRDQKTYVSEISCKR